MWQEDLVSCVCYLPIASWSQFQITDVWQNFLHYSTDHLNSGNSQQRPSIDYTMRKTICICEQIETVNRCLHKRPRGLMDKASDFGSEDCVFDSRRGRFFFFFFFFFFFLSRNVASRSRDLQAWYIDLDSVFLQSFVFFSLGWRRKR